MAIIIGMGTGRCGTTSLAKLLSAQEGAGCFHELNAAGMSWEGAELVVRARLDAFDALIAGGACEMTVAASEHDNYREYESLRALSDVTTIGDVGFYYLPYVPMLAGRSAAIRMPCLRRDRAGTVKSYAAWMKVRNGRRWGRRRYIVRNHFATHDGQRWGLDEKWDKCYPKYPGPTLEEAIGRYWDDYYETAERLAERYPKQFRVFEMQQLNSSDGQRCILKFCGFETPRLALVHANATR